jgi:hypothetical protein
VTVFSYQTPSLYPSHARTCNLLALVPNRRGNSSTYLGGTRFDGRQRGCYQLCATFVSEASSCVVNFFWSELWEPFITSVHSYRHLSLPINKSRPHEGVDAESCRLLLFRRTPSYQTYIGKLKCRLSIDHTKRKEASPRILHARQSLPADYGETKAT